MMKIIKGDLIKLALDGHIDVIVHGCNCQCTMGAGIAKSIKDIFPEAYAADLSTPRAAARSWAPYRLRPSRVQDSKSPSSTAIRSSIGAGPAFSSTTRPSGRS
ncbi:hypothetical protein ACQR0Z_11425 [Bradyrhizobium sp. HKCCYLS3077]|uniref:hypothetical protein n=1 Tax=Bradyrhizobium sp. HKCCYLS3077 TaxID=3420761 RepID=UPI003EBC941E